MKEKKRNMKNEIKILFLLLFSIFLIGNVYAFSGSGDGSSGNPYIITNCTQLQEMSNDLNANYSLGNNIDCSDTVNWNGGNGYEASGYSIDYEFNIIGFTGTFDGQNYNITNLFIKNQSINIANENEDQITYMTAFIPINMGIIENVNFINLTLDYNETRDYEYGNPVWYDGGLTVLNLGGTIINCHIFGGKIIKTSVYYHESFSPMVSIGMGGNIINSSFNGNIYLEESDSAFLGGIIGYNEGKGDVTNCYSIGNFTSPGYNAITIGGLIGRNKGDGYITNSYSLVNIRSNQDLYIGGLIGENERYSQVSFNSYYSGYLNGIKNNMICSGSGDCESKTDEEMLNQSSYSGWDFNNICDIRDGFLPHLSWENYNFESPIPPEQNENVESSPIYQTMNIVGAGLGIFIEIVSHSFAPLLVGLLFVSMFIVIGSGIVYIFLVFEKWMKGGR